MIEIPVAQRAARAAVARDRRPLLIGLVFAAVLLLRWHTIGGGLSGDDHWSLWNATAFLKGDRPFHEFVDVGDPLYWAMSALAQVVFGYRPLSEVILGSLLIASAFAISFHLAWEASGSWRTAAALTAAAALLMTVTKLYSYPKIFVYPLGLWLGWRYIERPTWLRSVLLATGVVVAFGYRHDHGAYVGFGAAVAVAAAHWKNGIRGVLLSVGRLGVATLVLLAPYFALIQANEGVISYFRERMRFAATLDEAARRVISFTIDRAAPGGLFAIAPPAPITVGVRWADGIASQVQHEAERRHALIPPPAPTQDGWHRYVVDDTSEANLGALAADRRVSVADGVDGSFRRAYAAANPTATGATIRVEWRDSVSSDRRASLERQYHLEHGRSTGATTRSMVYDMREASSSNVTALAVERDVQGLGDVDFVKVPVAARLQTHIPAGPFVSLRWADGTTAEQRALFEARHGLVSGQPDPGDPDHRVRRYELADRSDANVTAIRTSPTIATVVAGLVRGNAPGLFRSPAWTPVVARVSVLWAPEATPAERADAERRYHLRPAYAVDSGMTAYTLTNDSPANLRSLVEDPLVTETSGIDRDRFSPSETRWTRLARQVPLLRMSIAPAVLHRENASVWLHYVSLALPFLVLAVLGLDRFRGRPSTPMPFAAQKMFVAAIMIAVANAALLKRVSSFADHADVAIVLGAWLLARIGRRSGLIPSTIAVTVVGVTLLATVVHGRARELVTSLDVTHGGRAAWDESGRQLASLGTMPPIDGYAPRDASGDRALIRYLYECTRPDDRIWVTTDIYTIPYYTERRVVGHVWWGVGFLNSPDYQRRTIDLLERDQVPLIIGVGGQRPLQYLEPYDRLYDYVARRYVNHYDVLQDKLNGLVIWIVTDSRRIPTGTYARLGLPCFK